MILTWIPDAPCFATIPILPIATTKNYSHSCNMQMQTHLMHYAKKPCGVASFTVDAPTAAVTALTAVTPPTGPLDGGRGFSDGGRV